MSFLSTNAPVINWNIVKRQVEREKGDVHSENKRAYPDCAFLTLTYDREQDILGLIPSNSSLQLYDEEV